jgi:hypothetical protein
MRWICDVNARMFREISLWCEPLDAGGLGGAINMKITERTQSEKWKNPLKTGHSYDAAAFAVAKRTQI